MSQQINWGVCPEATHYLPAQIAGVGHNSFWCMNGSIPISKWREDGTFCANSGLFMNDADMARLIAKKLDRAPVALDWSTAPEDATHAWDDGHGGRWYKLEATGTLWLFKWGVWEFCQRNDGEPLDVSDLIPRPKAEPELPDKSKWPAGATHFTPAQGPNRRPVFWRVEGGLGMECWPVNEADMTVCDHMRYGPTGCVTFSMKGAIELPKAEEFVPLDFSGSVVAHGLPLIVKPWEGELPPPNCPVDYLGIDGEWKDGTYVGSYLGQAVVACRESGVVGFLEFKAGSMKWQFDLAAPGSDRSVTSHWVGNEVVAVWERGLPPAGTHCIVTPHNTQWGFTAVGDYECTVIAYHEDYVWLMVELSEDIGGKYILTRTDKVGFKPRLTPEQAAKEKRIAAAQEWLKGIEQDYGKEVADQCEDILMEGEKRLAAKLAAVGGDV